MVDIDHRQQQLAAVALLSGDFDRQALAPGGAIGQPGEGILQGLLALGFEVVLKALGFLLHGRHPPHQRLQSLAHFLLAGRTLVLVAVHGVEQAVEVPLQALLEVVEVGGILHAGLQPADLLAQLVAQGAGAVQRLGIALLGGAEVFEEQRQTLVELLEVAGELALAVVGHRQDQHAQVVQYRHQLVPVEPADQALAQGIRLRLVEFGQVQLIEQRTQAVRHMGRDRAIAGLGRRGQGVGGVAFAGDQRGRQGQAIEGAAAQRFGPRGGLGLGLGLGLGNYDQFRFSGRQRNRLDRRRHRRSRRWS
ncbi:hypothetical protein D9M71_252490 [compost metagenome]